MPGSSGNLAHVQSNSAQRSLSTQSGYSSGLVQRHHQRGSRTTEPLSFPSPQLRSNLICRFIDRHNREGTPMKTKFGLPLAIVIGFVLGAVAIKDVHAQTKAPLYVVTEIDVKDLDPYLKEYVPKAQALIKKSGGRFLAVGQNVSLIEGAPPKKRVALQVWDSKEPAAGFLNQSLSFRHVLL